MRVLLKQIMKRHLPALLMAHLLMHSGCTTIKSQDASGSGVSKGNVPIFLWEVADPKHPSKGKVRIFGTIHINDKSNAFLDKAVVRSMAGIDRLFLEVAPEEMQAETVQPLVLREGMLAAGSNLSEQLSPETMQKLMLTMDKLKIPTAGREKLMRMRPWLLAIALTTSQFKAAGVEINYGGEAQLTAMARERQKPILGIETLEYQLKALAGIDQKLQEYQLVVMLDSILGIEKGENRTLDIFEAYRQGDYGKLSKVAQEMADNPQSRSFYEQLLVKRNLAMADRIKGLLLEKQSSLVAIGALHMAGPSNILQLLRKDGYQVKRVRSLGRSDRIWQLPPSNPQLAAAQSPQPMPALESFERDDSGGWQSMIWQRSAASQAQVSRRHPSDGTRSLEIQIKSVLTTDQEIIIGRQLSSNLSGAEKFTFDVFNKTGKNLLVSLAMTLGSEHEWYESKTVTLQPGANRGISFTLKSSEWKTEASQWQYTQPLKAPEAIHGVFLKFIPDAKPVKGSIFIDRIVVK